MRPLSLRWWLVLFVFASMSSLAANTVPSDEAPFGAVAQVVAIDGSAVFAADERTLMRHGGEHHLDDPAIQLRPGQWLQPGQVVMARENAALTLRYVDGREIRVGPRPVPVYAKIERPHPKATPAPASSQAAWVPQFWIAFERAHRSALLFAFGVLIAVLPLLRRTPYRPGTGARLTAAALFALLTLPMSLLIVAGLTLGRMAWYQLPLPGADWTGSAAAWAQAANGVSLVFVLGGLVAFWVLSLSFVSGGADRLGRRGAAWWCFATAGIACITLAFVVPHISNLDRQPEWLRFWSGWSRDYSRGAWLLVPFAQLLACAPAKPNAGLRWQGIAASGVAVVFIACYVGI